MTAATTTPTFPLPSTRTTARPVSRAGLAASVAAAIAAQATGQIAHAAGVPLRAGNIGAATAEKIPTGGFATMTLMWGVVGVLMAAAFARWARRPARTWITTTVALTAVSLLGPALAGATATSTKVTLALAHIVAAAVIIPVVARRLPEQGTRRAN
jgi:hypothetical protein